MKQVLIFLGLTLSLLSGADASASVSHFLYTPLPLTPVSAASSEVKIAGIYWLPDYLKDNVSRDYNSNTSDDKGGGDTVKVCSDYGFISPADLDLDVYTCSSYDTVPVHGLSCYNSCQCKSGFTYTSANCNASAGYVLSGKSCEGKYQSCTCSKECCSDSMCGSDQRCSSGSCVSTCTNTITASDCAAECKNTGSTSEACTRDGVTYYAACGASKCGSNQVCSSGSCVCASGYKLCGTTCIPSSNCCTNADCSGGQQCSSGSCGCASGYKSCNGACIPSSNCCTDADCGSDQSCFSGSCVNNCTPLTDESGCGIRGTKSCSDNCGGYRQCCKTAAEYCKEQGYNSGITCEAGQTTETCSADSSYKKCTGSACPSSKTCSYGCKTYSSQSGCSNVCTVCKTAAEYCKEQGYTSGITCEAGQTTETCSADSSYKKCTGEACPSSPSCDYGCQTYSTQSGCSNVCTACYPDNCRNQTAVTIPANASCSTYYSDCSSKCQAWSCNSGYTQSGSSCVCATTCADKITSKPENSTYVTESCTACGTTTNIKTGWTCDSGYNQSGNTCIAACTEVCEDTVTSKPENSSYTTEQCTACGFSKTINTGWKCNDGYSTYDNECCSYDYWTDCTGEFYLKGIGDSCAGRYKDCECDYTGEKVQDPYGDYICEMKKLDLEVCVKVATSTSEYITGNFDIKVETDIDSGTVSGPWTGGSSVDSQWHCSSFKVGGRTSSYADLTLYMQLRAGGSSQGYNISRVTVTQPEGNGGRASPSCHDGPWSQQAIYRLMNFYYLAPGSKIKVDVVYDYSDYAYCSGECDYYLPCDRDNL